MTDVVLWVVLVAVVLFLWHCPIIKPYFGWRLKSRKDLGQ